MLIRPQIGQRIFRVLERHEEQGQAGLSGNSGNFETVRRGAQGIHER